MLPILHSAPYLFREDAYREYCWNVDMWGMYQPASFIYLSFEAFREAALQHSLLLTVANPPESSKERFPTRAERVWTQFKPSRYYGFIFSLENLNDADKVPGYLEQGHNVICLIPNEFIGTYNHHLQRTDILTTSRACMARLGLGSFQGRLTGAMTNNAEIWWSEVSQQRGRLFITEDGFLSDGYFLEGYGKTDSNAISIANLLKEFSVRREPLLLITPDGEISHWSCHEPFLLTLRVKNFGPTLTDARLSVALDDSCEPTSPTEIRLPPMLPLAEASVAFQFIPRVAKKVDPIVNISAIINGNQIDVVSKNYSLDVLASLKTLLWPQHVADDEEFSRLSRMIVKTTELAELKNFSQLARIDTEACLNKIRKVAERLSIFTLKKASVAATKLNFYMVIGEIQKRKLMSAKAVSYFHTIRSIGNLASHPSGENLTVEDIRVVAYALAAIVEEMLDRRIL